MPSFERRSFLLAATGAFVLGGTAGNAGATVDSSSGALDFTGPADALTAMLRLQHRLDGKDAPWWYFGRIYAMLPGRAPIPLFRFEGLEISRLVPVNAGEYAVTGVTTSFFLDWSDKQRLATFENPITGRTDDVTPNLIGGRDGFVAAYYSARGVRPGRVDRHDWRPDGLHVSWERYGNKVWLSHDRSYPPGLPQPVGESSVASASVADLMDLDNPFVPASFSSTYFAPYPSWMTMEGQPGYVIWHADGVKLPSVDQLPARFRGWMNDGYRDRLRTPALPDWDSSTTGFSNERRHHG